MSLLQSLFSLFCLSYASCMGMPPTLAAVIHGSKQILGIDLRSLYNYLDVAALGILSLFLVAQWWLCGRLPRYRRRWPALIPACVLLAAQCSACLIQPPRQFSPEFATGEDRALSLSLQRAAPSSIGGTCPPFCWKQDQAQPFRRLMLPPKAVPLRGRKPFLSPQLLHRWLWYRWNPLTLNCWK